jgi:DNA-directed RNA polymerase specialized sigma24 family protein
VSDEPNTRDLLRRIRSGDADAAAELVRRYEPEIRRAIRVKLTDPRLRRVLDSVDVCQSVLGNFFVRAAAGQFELDNPRQLLGLLVTMARNKVLDHARRQQADRRDQRRLDAGAAGGLEQVADGGPGPGSIVAGRELLEEVRRRLSDEERELAEERAQGRDWAAIAADRGGSAEALRKKLARALDRVARQMGLEEADDD